MPDGAHSSPVIADTGHLIFQKMPMILAEIGAIEKKGRNTKQNFNFRGIDQVYAALYPLLAAHKVFMTAAVLGTSREERNSNSGGVLAFTCIHMRYRFNAEDGSFVETEAYGEGMDSGDKSSNKAMAVAHKYAILQALCVPTEDVDDPDKDSHEVAPRPEPASVQPQKQDTVTAKEEWANKQIAAMATVASAVKLDKFLEANKLTIDELEPYQRGPFDKAVMDARRRLTGMSAPTPSNNKPINLDDEIRW